MTDDLCRRIFSRRSWWPQPVNCVEAAGARCAAASDRSTRRRRPRRPSPWRVPAAIVHVGIAGTRRARALPPATLVIGIEARYHDLVVPARLAPGVVVTVAGAGRRRRAAPFPEAPRLAIGTSGRIGGTTDTDVEAMEGFAVLRAAQMAGVPAIEVRASRTRSSKRIGRAGTSTRPSLPITRGDAAPRRGGGAMRELTFGYSPCPNDTFAFHALTHGLIDAPFRIRPVLLDIEELNRRAHGERVRPDQVERRRLCRRRRSLSPAAQRRRAGTRRRAARRGAQPDDAGRCRRGRDRDPGQGDDGVPPAAAGGGRTYGVPRLGEAARPSRRRLLLAIVDVELRYDRILPAVADWRGGRRA